MIDGQGVQQIRIDVGPSGYTPALVRARSGVPTRMTLRTTNTSSCTNVFVVPSLGVQRQLAPSDEAVVDLGTLPQGILRYTCGMGMYSGAIEVR